MKRTTDTKEDELFNLDFTGLNIDMNLSALDIDLDLSCLDAVLDKLTADLDELGFSDHSTQKETRLGYEGNNK